MFFLNLESELVSGLIELTEILYDKVSSYQKEFNLLK
jgi:hypothetical protein